MKKYILNPKYLLRHEGDKTYIMGDPNVRGRSIISVIHPIYAMMLSFFNGIELEEAFDKISSFLHLPKDVVKKRLMTLVDNQEIVTDGTSMFPKKLIVDYKESMPLHSYRPEQFSYSKTDIRISRLQSPSDIICNVTMRCRTSCFYCYADRKGNSDKYMSIELLEKIIEEAKRIGVLRFQLMGGEVLLYKDWERALRKLAECGYSPWISTKMPLTEKHISIMKDLNFISPVQISLDTLIKDNLYAILNVSDPYYEQILYTFELLEKYKLEYIVHTVLNKKNATIEDMKSLVDFLKSKRSLSGGDINAAKCSMYIGTCYNSYRAPDDKIKEVANYILGLKKEKVFNFDVVEPSVLKDINTYSKEEKKRIFNKRNLCSGNLNALYILPDGQVTICEELYWHSRFLLGDLHTQSLEEIWKSKKAKDLFFLKQSDIQEASACKTCEDFAKCREYLHFCWRDVILAYGKENWDYPGIFCPKAPRTNKDVFV